MGRTNDTYRNHLERFFESLGKFRKELRKKNTGAFDSLKKKAFRHSHAGSAMNSKNPAMPAIISMMVGLQLQLNRLEHRIEELEE